jgi:hypothetical protein
VGAPLSVRYHEVAGKTLEKWRGLRAGEAFYNDNPDTRTLRLSYSTVSLEGLQTAVERLAKSQLLFVPRRSLARNVLHGFIPFPQFCRQARSASAMLKRRR